MTVRDSFVATFGKELANELEIVTETHRIQREGGIGQLLDEIFRTPGMVSRPHGDDNRGSDPFKYTLISAIGHECLTHPVYREYHNFEHVDPWAVNAWLVEHGDLDDYDGDVPDHMARVLQKFHHLTATTMFAHLITHPGFGPSTTGEDS